VSRFSSFRAYFGYSVLTSAALLSHTAYADEESSKAVSAELVVEWQNEYRKHSDDPATDETNNSFMRTELAPTIRLSEHVFIDGVLVFEPFDQAAELNAGDDIWFDREGGFAEELKLNVEYGPYAAWIGKFNPSFGKAWDYGRGIWSEDFAEDYEITEKLGVGGAYALDTEKAGTHTFSATTFFADTSFLSEGVITSRDNVSLEDGGASNTEDFSSYTLSLEGEDVGGVENLGYTLGYRHLGEQDKNRDVTTDSETGYTAGLT